MNTEELKTRIAAYKVVSVKRSVDVIENIDELIEKLHIKSKGCLGNAYQMGERTKAKSVEGIVLTRVNGEFDGVFGHCWNKINDSHFDLTIDFAPPAKLDEVEGVIEYTYFAKDDFDCAEYKKAAENKHASLSIWYEMSHVNNPGSLELDFLTDSRNFGKELNKLTPNELALVFAGFIE